MKALFFTVFFAVGALAIGMMAMDMGGDEAIVEPDAPVLTELGQRMVGAESRGASLFQYDDGEGYALCQGTTYIARLGREIKELKLSSQESLNLSLCRKNDAGNYQTVQNIAGVAPGDYLSWGDVFSWTGFERAELMVAENQSPKETPVEEAVEEAPVVEEPMVAEELLPSQAKFELSGTPTGNPALFVDGALTALINPGSSAVLSLEGADERCGVSLQLLGSSGEWEHIHSFGCIDYGASIEMAVDGTAVTIQ